MTTSRDKDFDVAVVGASIAGCTAATLLGRGGLRVALIDKHSGPDAYKRLCGHFIQPSATATIKRLGLADEIESAGGVRNGIDLWSRWGMISSPESLAGREHGYSIRRSKLDPILRRTAIETDGVEYMPGMEAVRLLSGDGSVAGVEVTDRHRKSTKIGARLVVGADGRNSKVAALAKSRERRAPNQRFCYMAYFTGIEMPGDRGRFWALDPDVAIASPNDDGIVLLAAFVHKDRLGPFREDREQALLDLFRAAPDSIDLSTAKPAGKVIGYTDYELIRREPSPANGVALVGDAALTSDPVMAIGCGWALQSGEWMADVLAPALAGGGSLQGPLRSYRRRHRQGLLGHHRMLTSDAHGKPMNPVQRMLFAAAATDPATATRFHRYAARSIGPSRLLSPASLARVATVNVRHRWGGHAPRPVVSTTQGPEAG